MSYTEFDLNRVYLMLGPACNYQCRHCIQKENSFAAVQPLVQKKSLDYILHLANKRPPQLEKITVMFWGGEPLLYLDTIKDIIEYLGEAVDYAMVSNGSLLNEEVAALLNDHKVHFILSNDGKNTARVRGENLLENEAFIKLFQQIEQKSIDAVITAYNQDYEALWAYLDAKIPGIPVAAEFLHCTWDMPEDVYDFDLDAYREMMNRMVQKAHEDTLGGNVSRAFYLLSAYRDDIMRVVGKIGKRENPVLDYPRCRQVRKAMNIDLSGNVYACHNFADQIGTVEDDYEDLLAAYDAKYTHYAQNADCQQCFYSIFCRGGCPFSKPSPGKEKCCAIVRIFIDSCIAYVMSFSDVLEEVEL